MTAHERRDTVRQFWIAAGLSLFAAIAFYFSTNATLGDLDYTSRIASALLSGHLGLREKPPDWLNEMIPHRDSYYSAFPLGAVLSMVPIALLQEAGLIHHFPGHVLAALIAGACVYFFFQLAKAFGADYFGLEGSALVRRILLALFPIFGTWTWCNLGFGGAWQIALALAFGNRTELLITLPLYTYFLWRRPNEELTPSSRSRMVRKGLRENVPMAMRFLSVPATLALLTAAYNFARFHSIFDFGYTHIPEVREEPWYEHGLFSIHAIQWNMYTMLFQGFESVSYFPHIQPNGFGCSIFLASPFLCLLFREGGRYKVAAWVAIASLTLVLWCHGNPGSWQFSYRYAMILLPWMFLLLTANGTAKITVSEISLFAVSVAINGMATWLFLWTEQIQP